MPCPHTQSVICISVIWHYLSPHNTLSLLLTFPWYPLLDRSHGTDFAKQLSSHLGSKIRGWAFEGAVYTGGWACLNRQQNCHNGSCEALSIFKILAMQVPLEEKGEIKIPVKVSLWLVFGLVFFFSQACFTSNNTNSEVLLLTVVIFIGSLGMRGINLQAWNLAMTWQSQITVKKKKSSFYSSLLWGKNRTTRSESQV